MEMENEDIQQGVTESVAQTQDSVNEAHVASEQREALSPKELNFRKLEESRNFEREQRLQLERQNAVLNDRLMRLEQQFAQSASTHAPKKDKEDLVTFGDYEQDIKQREAQLAERLMKIEAKTNYPDLDDVINKYGKKLSPAVAQACLRADNPFVAVYEACKNSDAYYKDLLANTQHENAKRASENAKKPLNPSSIGTKGSIASKKDYSKMSLSEIARMGDNYRKG